MDTRTYVIGICDDDEFYRKRLARAVHLMCEQMQISIKLKTYDSGEAVLAETEDLDILLLDEELTDDGSGLNGRDVRAWMERKNKSALIICITSYEKYMQDSFGANIMGFVTKGRPDEQQRLVGVFRRCVERFEPEIKVAYIEAQRHRIKIVSTDGRENIISCSIETAEKQCKEKKNFVRCQRSYIVNLEYVGQVVGNFDKFIMKDGIEISISRSNDRKQAVKSAYLSYKERKMFDLFGAERA